MSLATRYVKALQLSNYMEVTSIKENVIDGMKLLKNGKSLANIFMDYWRTTSEEWPTIHVTTTDDHNFYTSDTYDFIESKTYKNNLRKLRETSKTLYPAVIKTSYESNTAITENSRDALQIFTGEVNQLYLITDYIIHPAMGFEQFTNIQRKRKIWWMHLASNSSRFYFQSSEDSTNKKIRINKCTSVTIKSKFPFGNINVEKLDFIPIKRENSKNLEVFDHSDRTLTPSVVRSAININLACSALLFDSCDHNRPKTLMINSKLAPYQCVVTTKNSQKVTNAPDLCKHISNEIRRAGLRVFETPNMNEENRKDCIAELLYADSIGIPYALMIEEDTLKTGLLGLRSRDTTLTEIIHISDIPKYLLNIFN